MNELIILTAIAAAMIAVAAFFLGYREGRKAPRRRVEKK